VLPRFGDDKNNLSIVSLTNTVRMVEQYDVDCVYLTLLKNFIQPLCYDELRTKQQLGYVVFVLSSTNNFSDEMSFLVQSDSYDPEVLTTRINEFRAKVPELAEKLSEEEFSGLVQSYITRMSIKDRSLFDNSEGYWGDMLTGELEFQLSKKLIELAKQTTREGFIAYAKKYLPPDAPDHRVCILEIWGDYKDQAEADAAGKDIKFADVQQTLSHPMFPVVRETRHKLLQPLKP